MEIVYKKIGELKPYENNPRKNDEAVDAVAASISEFGWKVPVVIDADNVIVAGHTRYKAAKKLGIEDIPCNLRITASSMAMYIIANLADITLFEKIKTATKGRYLWVRNNVATIVCNCLENFGFIFLAFIGIYDARTCFEIAVATSVIEIVAAVCDTPFLYLSNKVKPLINEL